jgi:MFS family permease
MRITGTTEAINMANTNTNEMNETIGNGIKSLSNIEMVEETPNLHDMTPQEELRLVRKMDIHIVPVVTILYFLSFLDRVNIGKLYFKAIRLVLLISIGNARLFGLESDLHLVGNEYQLCVSLVFVTYVSFELPTNIFLKKLSPKLFIPTIAVGWGLVSMCTGFVQNKSQLIALRLLLGCFEAGYFPGICFYLTFWYRRREYGIRIFYLFAASAVSGSVGGLLAYGIGHMLGLQGMSAWRWLMIIEGVPTVVTGLIAYLILENDPLTAPWLTEREKYLTRVRRSLDQTSLGLEDDGGKIQWDQVIASLKDWKTTAHVVASFGVTLMLYGYSTFLPTIIKALGYTGITTQLLTIPCYSAGAIVYLAVAYWSDRTGKRGYFIVGGCITSSAGYAILLGATKYGSRAQYAGCILVACGLYVAVGLAISWVANNMPSHYKRATTTGLVFMTSSCSGIMAPFIYPTKDAPKYQMGHAITLGFVVLSGAVFALISLLLYRENKRRDQSGNKDDLLQGLTPAQIARLGDWHPSYRYIY